MRPRQERGVVYQCNSHGLPRKPLRQQQVEATDFFVNFNSEPPAESGLTAFVFFQLSGRKRM